MAKIMGKRFDRSVVRNILVRADNWVGDAVMGLPALEGLRHVFPGSSISVLAKPWVAPLFEGHPAVDKVIPFRKGEGAFANPGEVVRVVRLIRRHRFDLAVLFPNSFEAALLVYLGRVKYRLGYNTDGRGFLLSHRVIRSKEILKVHQIEYYLYLLRAMGWKAISKDPSLHVMQEYRDAAGNLLLSAGIRNGDILVGLAPGAVFGDAKRWPPERFAKIGDWAIQRWGAKIVLMGSPGEVDICNRVSRSMAHRPIDFCGRTRLGEAMGVIGQCDFFVTNDSGLMHISAALGVPTVVVFGSTDAVTTGPRGPKTRIVKHDIDCAPCLKSKCPTDHRCMLSITPEEVWAEIEKFRREPA